MRVCLAVLKRCDTDAASACVALSAWRTECCGTLWRLWRLCRPKAHAAVGLFCAVRGPDRAAQWVRASAGCAAASFSATALRLLPSHARPTARPPFHRLPPTTPNPQPPQRPPLHPSYALPVSHRCRRPFAHHSLHRSLDRPHVLCQCDGSLSHRFVHFVGLRPTARTLVDCPLHHASR